MANRIALIVGMLLPWLGVAGAEVRIWTDSTGKHTIEAEFVGLADGNVTLKKADGKETILPLAKLSEADQEIASKLASAAKPNPGEVSAMGNEEQIAAIKKLGGLFIGTSLILSGPNVTDAGLVHLKGMTGLKALFLGDAKVTDAGATKLKAALPNCIITY
jgi:hypothetical protein